MLSYCWGERNEATGTFETQELVLRVFRELVRRRFAVWVDVMGGVVGNINRSMAR